jgi:hypothetical protein
MPVVVFFPPGRREERNIFKQAADQPQRKISGPLHRLRLVGEGKTALVLEK